MIYVMSNSEISTQAETTDHSPASGHAEYSVGRFKRSDKFRRNLIVALFIGFLLPVAGQANTNFDRHEKMLINLRAGTGSAGFYLFEAARLSKEMEKDLRKALFQIREVDKSYAKSRGKPDDRYLEPATLKVARCQEKADLLQKEIKDAFLDLKEGIRETLTTEAAGK